MPAEKAQFVFMTCRAGTEAAVKHEVARVKPTWRFSYSRPGFLTFKSTETKPVDEQQLAERNWTFAHANGISLGRIVGEQLRESVTEIWNHAEIIALTEQGGWADIHVWERASRANPPDLNLPFEVTPLCQEIESAMRAAAPASLQALNSADVSFRRASPRNGRVLDLIVLQPNEWWLGYHRATRRHERWPGGAIPVRMPPYAVSRAYAKLEEAIQWSGLPIAAGDECVEVGCAPGGASQALLDRGLFVTGIDPAEVDSSVVEHPRFRHLKKRCKDVQRKEFEGVRWLTADMNIAPEATLEEVERIVTLSGVSIRGMVLTLKMSNWSAAERLPEFIARVRGWGYRDVRTRQLVTGGQEVCLVALRRKSLRRLGRELSHKRPKKPQQISRTDAPHSTLFGPHF